MATAKNTDVRWLDGGRGVTELKAYENTENIKSGVYMLTLLASCKGRTYQMKLLLNNSIPQGFNTRRCVSVLGEGWHDLADNTMVCVGREVSVYDQLPAIREYARELFRAFEEYISYL